MLKDTRHCKDRTQPQPYGFVVVAMASESMETDGSGVLEQLQLAEMACGSAPLVPIVEVAFRNDMWWSMPQVLSQQLIARMTEVENAVYTWNWSENGRTGSWAPDGESTSVNRYMHDFELMLERNIDNGRQRSIRIVYVRREDVTARCTGELPPQ